MIQVDNYENEIVPHLKSLPKILLEGHQFFLEAINWYDSDETVRETIDLYLEKLNLFLKPKTEKAIDILYNERFLKIQNQLVSREQIGKYISDLQKSIISKQIRKSSLYARHIIQIQDKLINQFNKLKPGESVKIAINKKWLDEILEVSNPELAGIPQSATNKSDLRHSSKASSLFQSMNEIDSQPSENSFRLPGDLGTLLGDLERFELAITLEGDQGGGKTRFGYQLANAFAELGHRVAVFSLEIGKGSDLIRRMRDEYIDLDNRPRVDIADQAPEGINTIRKYSRTYDVVLIDSWNKLDVHSSAFDKLRKDFPNTMFIVIFQRTTQGTIRGGTAPLFDAGINLEVVKVDDSFRNNYAVATKNRYGETGIQYNIFNAGIIRGYQENKNNYGEE